MNLNAWLHHLETFSSGLNNKSLVNVKKVAKKLDITRFNSKIIVVGGTNGKGSCVTFLEAILRASGYKTGAYISPHILRYNERIRLNGKDIDDQTLSRVFAEVENARANTDLSYFEFTTLVALKIFKQYKLDVLILEVGLGGRFDAVNILDADIAIVTSISLDHTKILGNTRGAIGREKAGIMRPFKPIIYGDPDVPKSIRVQAKKTSAIFYSVNKDFTYGEQNGKWYWRCAQKTIKGLPLPKLPIANAATALMAIKLLRPELKISKRAIVAGLKRASLPGRLQSISIDGREIIFDVAHNPGAAQLLAKNISKFSFSGRMLAVVSMFGDKNITATLQKLTKIVNKWYIGVLADSRAASSSMLRQGLLKAGGRDFVLLPNIAKALKLAIAESKRSDKIVVFGSFRTVADGLKTISWRKNES